MTALVWDQSGQREYETGVDRGVLYIPDATGAYPNGYAWNGLTGITEAPSGAAPTPKFADNIKYLNLLSQEEFGGTISAFMYPDQWAQCDGSAIAQPGVWVAQQTRKPFGLSYRTKVGNDLLALDYGYKIHLVYGALAEPAQKAFNTVNDTPDAIDFQWKFSTTGVAATNLKNTAQLLVDSTMVTPANLAALELILYGSAGVAPRLPLPDEVIALFAGAVTTVTTLAPTYTPATHTLVVPTVTGVQYKNGTTGANVVNGSSIVLTVGQTYVLKAVPLPGYVFSVGSDDDWSTLY